MASKQNFLVAHWDWLVAGLGVAALVASGTVFGLAKGTSPEDAASERQTALKTVAPKNVAVAPADRSALDQVFRNAQTPPALAEVDPKKASFLASERRVICQQGDAESKVKACGRPIPAGLEKCPFCGVKQNVVKVEVDTDRDGMPNDWEKKYGLNPADPSDAAKDTDKDGFTNLEEFLAGTDPRDAKSHPDYLDSVSVAGGLKQTHLPFYFNNATQIPGGHRFTFQRPGMKGFDAKVSVKLNEEIAGAPGKNQWKSGWKVVAYVPKTEKRKVAGTNITKPVDVSTVDVERIADGKKLTARINERGIAIESQAELRYNRGEDRTITVSEGTEFDLNGSKYRALKLKGTESACEVTILDLTTKKEKTVR